MGIGFSKRKESVSAVQCWGVGFLLGFLTGVIPTLSQVLSNKIINPFEGWVHAVWWTGLFFSAMGISILHSQRVWRWGIAVGLGLPAAVAIGVFLDLLQDSTSNSSYLFAIFYSLFVAVPTALAGAVSGFLIKRTVEVLRKK